MVPMTGHVHIDEQARALLDGCARLADTSPLDHAVAVFKAQVRALFDAEEVCLADGDEALRDEQSAEREEFEAFADEVLSATHFDAAELQRFATAWSLGHLRSAAARLCVR